MDGIGRRGNILSGWRKADQQFQREKLCRREEPFGTSMLAITYMYNCTTPHHHY